MQRFTAACAQYAVAPMDIEENLRRAVTWTRRAFDESGAQLIVLPETVTTGFTPNTGPEGLWDVVERAARPALRATSARQPGAWRVSVLRHVRTRAGAARGVVYNSAALLGPNGDILGVYRKTHLFPTESGDLSPRPPLLLRAGRRRTPGRERLVHPGPSPASSTRRSRASA